MAFLAINGSELPPCKRGVSVIVSTVVNSGRNADGVVVGQRIGRDLYKINDLEWAYLTADQWGYILGLMSEFFFNVSFQDPVTSQIKTVQMYCGDRTATPFKVDEFGQPLSYKDCKVNLIDTGAGKVTVSDRLTTAVDALVEGYSNKKY